MLAKKAKEIARDWVAKNARKWPGFEGAFLHGSINWLPDRAMISPTSDVDIMVVATEEPPRLELGKFHHQGVTLEVSYLPADEIKTAEDILGAYHLAGSFHRPSILADKTGRLTRLQQQVASVYATRTWVLRRVHQAEAKVRSHLNFMDQAQNVFQRVTAWLFGTGVTTHVLLVAGLKNPTVRKRYVAAGELLLAYRLTHVYEELLDLLGCAHMTAADVTRHIDTLEQVFDEACHYLKTPFPFSADINSSGRQIAVDGSRELVDHGLHREAVFWIAATQCRSQMILLHDAPLEVQRRHRPGFDALIHDLGVSSPSRLEAARRRTESYLPELMKTAEQITAENPAIINT